MIHAISDGNAFRILLDGNQVVWLLHRNAPIAPSLGGSSLVFGVWSRTSIMIIMAHHRWRISTTQMALEPGASHSIKEPRSSPIVYSNIFKLLQFFNTLISRFHSPTIASWSWRYKRSTILLRSILSRVLSANTIKLKFLFIINIIIDRLRIAACYGHSSTAVYR